MEGVHPLLLPHILKNTFHYLRLGDLENFRLVNQDWNSAACIEIAFKKTIIFKSIRSIESYGKIFRLSQFLPHSAFILEFKTPTDALSIINSFVVEFQSSIKSLSITLGSGFLGIKELKYFLDKLPHIECIGIRFHYFNCIEELDEGSSCFSLEIIPTLKTLNISMESYECSWDSATMLLDIILRAAPNLRKITHPYFCIPPTKCRIPSLMNIFLTDLIVKERLALAKLSSLEFIAKLNENNIHMLLQRKFSLRHLYMNLWYPDDEELCVTSASLKLITSQLAPSLESLGIDFPWRRDVSYEFQFQVTMKRLKYLSLNGFQGSLIKLLDKLPYLQSMELSQMDLHEILLSANAADIYSQVLKLRIDFCTNQTAGLMSRFSRIFPNLKSLDINHVTNEVAKMICKKMSSLTHLRFHGDDLDDEGLTGIPINIAKENQLLSCSTSKGNSLRRYPFIGDLTNLTHLKLEAYQLTEACIQHGIVHCTSLHFVTMDTRPEKNDTTETVTRTFRLADYNNKMLSSGGSGGTLILREEISYDDEDDVEQFFKMYEKGMATDLLFV